MNLTLTCSMCGIRVSEDQLMMLVAAQKLYEGSQLDRIERKLDAILNGAVFSPQPIPESNSSNSEPTDEPEELTNALAELGF